MANEGIIWSAHHLDIDWTSLLVGPLKNNCLRIKNSDTSPPKSGVGEARGHTVTLVRGTASRNHIHPNIDGNTG